MTAPRALADMEAWFERAAALTGEAQAILIDGLRGQDPRLAEDLSRLLRADALSASHTLPKLEAPTLDSRLPPETKVGSFVLREWIGAGGMSQVYRAERPAGTGVQQAAVKILSQAVSQRARERMLREQELLARIRHPGIARLLESGQLDDGRPYLAMDYVAGENLQAHSDRQRLGLHARLDLIRQVGEIVAFAHANLILHRDLKCDNVLIDEAGKPVLLDFGIAKSLAEAVDASQTQEHSRFLSPRTAAPEQWTDAAQTTAVDVYGLGALAYELLSGTALYADIGASMLELQAAVRERTPPALDKAYAQAEAGKQQAIAEARGTTVAELRKQLADTDLNAIISRCLRKDPAARYASAADFVADLECWLNGRPVLARNGNWRYVTGKFLRRHWRGASASAALLLTAGSALWWIERSTQVAEAESTRADQAQELLLEAIRSADPSGILGTSVTAADILARAESLIDAHKELPVESKSASLLALASTRIALNDWERAWSLLERLPQLPPPDLAGEILQARVAALNGLSKTDEADRLLEAVGDGPSSGIESLLIQRLRVRQHIVQGRYPEALAASEALQSELDKLGIREGRQRRAADFVHAQALSAGRKPEEAAQVLERSLVSLDQAKDTDMGERLQLLGRLAEEYDRTGNYAKSYPTLEAAQQLRSQIYGEESFPYQVARGDKVAALVAMGRKEEAAIETLASLEAVEQRLGESHRRTAMMTFNAALVLGAKEPPDPRALELFALSVARAKKSFAADHPNVFLFSTVYSLKSLQHARCDLAEAAAAQSLDMATRNADLRDWDLHLAAQVIAPACRYLAGDRNDSAVVSLFRDAKARQAKGDIGNSTADALLNIQQQLTEAGIDFPEDARVAGASVQLPEQ